MALNPLLQSLTNPTVYDHEVGAITVIETHISWVILTGTFVYKIKKPVKFCFLDYSSLEKRKFYCEEEIRLNSRTAKSLYLGVVAIRGTHELPTLSQHGSPIEYAVKMRQFPQEHLFSALADDDQLKTDHIDRLASEIAASHRLFDGDPKKKILGSAENIHFWAMDNFIQINNLPPIGEDKDLLGTLEDWSKREHQKKLIQFEERRNSGFIKECHGDLHLSNIVMWEDKPTLFDCIEFNEELRWIDVISEIAYVVIDLKMHQQNSYACRFLNKYLQLTGDYSGLHLLKYYSVYRAMVVAKVRKIKAIQQVDKIKNQNNLKDSFLSYIQFASELIENTRPKLIIMHGLSGSGKSTLAAQLVESMSVLQIRSDIERKRLAGFDSFEETHSEIDKGIYSRAASSDTYQKLAELAETVLNAGYTAIVDACFLKIGERKKFHAVAKKLAVPFIIMSCQAETDSLKKRIIERANKKDDPSEADVNVLMHQLENNDELNELEKEHTLIIDTERRQPQSKELEQMLTAFGNKLA